ncbi:hypothetical protein [Flavobacterium sp.]|jgi:hypothetical protein|uniref:hypothetical protein n=1 Tax=Flavobacterium sp. TaxID=239 RepID=UPI0037C04D0B
MAQFIILLLLLGIASLIGQLGKNRRIGFGWSFALSFFLSPIIGLIITLCSKKNDIDFVDIKKED